MATSQQKEAARRNIGKARQAQSARARGKDIPPAANRSLQDGSGATLSRIHLC